MKRLLLLGLLGVLVLVGQVSAETPTLWYGEYYDNEWFAGQPVFTRSDEAINFDWGSGSPDPRIPDDFFSVRWRRTIHVNDAGLYQFTAIVDDTLKVIVNNEVVFDITEATDLSTSIDNPEITPSVAQVQFKKGANYIYVEYKEKTFPARVLLYVQPVSAQPNYDWQASYYNNASMTGQPVLQRVESYHGPMALDHVWREGSPDPNINADFFSASYRRILDVPEAGMYRMDLSADDNAELLVDGRSVLKIENAWGRKSAEVYLTQGQHTLQINYREYVGWAYLDFFAVPLNP